MQSEPLVVCVSLSGLLLLLAFSQPVSEINGSTLLLLDQFV